MNIEVFTEAALSESYLFQTFNRSAQLTKRVLSAVQDGEIIDKSMIEEQIIQMEKVRVSVLTERVLEAYERGDIVLVYSNKQKMPSALPFTVTRSADTKGLKAFIFVGNFGTISTNMNGDRYFNATMKDLYSLMEAAYIGLEYAKDPIRITKKLGLMKTSVEIYTLLILKLLNKEFALSMDHAAYDKVSFVIAKFFLERVWMSTNKEINFSYAKAVNPSNQGANILELQILNDEYDSANIKTFDDLVKFLPKVTPRITSNFTISYFMDGYIRMYKPAATFGLEVLPYFFFMITSSLIGSFIVRSDVVTSVTKYVHGMNKFYTELTKSIV